jgi:D-sedoheptulose 7-phosphate isomerase
MKAVSRLSHTRATDAQFEMKAPVDIVLEHLRQVGPALASLRNESSRLAGWGEELARRLLSGNRLLTAGSAGSAAELQQFTAELLTSSWWSPPAGTGTPCWMRRRRRGQPVPPSGR